MIKNLVLVIAFLLYLSPDAGASGREIRIAMWKLPLNMPSIVAMEQKAYERAFEGEYLIRYIDLPSGPKQVQAIAAGELDIVEGLGAGAVLVGIANGVDMTIIGANSRSPEAFAVVVKDPRIMRISDLKGKKVAGLRGSVVHQLFVELLRKEGLSEKDVEFFPMTLNASASALIAERVDSALLAGTEIVRAEKGGCRVLKDGRGVLRGLSLIAARRSFAENHPAAIEKYLAFREKILIEAARSLERVLPLLGKETGLQENEVRKLLAKFDYDTKITNTDIEELKNTGKYLKRENFIKIIPEINIILWNHE